MRMAVNNGSPSDHAYFDNDLEEDDLYVFLEQRWIITINFNSQQLQSNIKEKISKSLMPSHRSISIPLSEQQQNHYLTKEMLTAAITEEYVKRSTALQ